MCTTPKHSSEVLLNGKVMFQEEQAEKARLQQQRQKMKEDPELKPRCGRRVFGYCLYH